MQARDESIARTLLGWYDRHARELPWRSRPGTLPPEPYRVWLSEVMLQQTTTAAVAPYFNAFTKRWPDIAALAAAEEGEVMAAWAGLGYYARARNLVACARAVAARGGQFPRTEAELRNLPGLGDYTAAAVAAIAFGERSAVVDANVARVVTRLFAIADPLPGAMGDVRRMTRAITPAERPGDFAQAMMDLGATICTARKPRCLLCPLRNDCRAYAKGLPEAYPVKAAKALRPSREGNAFWIARGGRVRLVRRPRRGLLGGMLALPDDGWSARRDGSGQAPFAGSWRAAGSVQHGFTHFSLSLRLHLLAAECAATVNGEDGEWWPIDRLDQAGLPTLFAKAATLALAQGEQG